jgi:trans-aconitate 2-methyltransferase
MPHEFNAAEYILASAHQKEWGGQIISELKLKGNEKVLDLGCGDGALTAEIASKLPQGSVLGIDSSQNMIEMAVNHKAPNLAFRLKDINNLDYVEEFDLIFSNASLHWVKDHSTLLKHAYSSLKPGGMIRFNFAAEGNCPTFIKIVKSAMEIPQYRRYFQTFEWPWYMPSIEEYETLVKTQPFREVKVWGENADRYFPDAESITKWIDQPSLVPFKVILQPPGRGIFRDLVVQKILESTRQADGRFFESFRRINVSAKK